MSKKVTPASKAAFVHASVWSRSRLLSRSATSPGRCRRPRGRWSQACGSSCFDHRWIPSRPSIVGPVTPWSAPPAPITGGACASSGSPPRSTRPTTAACGARVTRRCARATRWRCSWTARRRCPGSRRRSRARGRTCTWRAGICRRTSASCAAARRRPCATCSPPPPSGCPCGCSSGPARRCRCSRRAAPTCGAGARRSWTGRASTPCSTPTSARSTATTRSSSSSTTASRS